MNESQLNVINLLIDAGPVVKIVILILVIASISSLAIIMFKRQLLIQASKQNNYFLKGFWGDWNFDECFTKASDFPLSPIAKVFISAVRELRKINKSPLGEDKLKDKTDLIERCLKKSAQIELSVLEASTAWLATTASAAPFIGLFGTVWGIMNSFQSIGITGNASLAAVAPGISEALIATAIGLAAAIPASIGYNYLANKIRFQSIEIHAFNQDLVNLLKRNKQI